MHTQFLRRPPSPTAESGFVMVLALIILLMLSLFGAWAIQTSRTELDVSSGLQQIETRFNLVEGGAYMVAGDILRQQGQWANITNFTANRTPGMNILPSNLDPGSDSAVAAHLIAPGLPATWPWENLLREYNANINNEFDFRHRVIYLGESPGKGTSHKMITAKFEVQAANARSLTNPATLDANPTIVEIGFSRPIPGKAAHH
jgi:hypothetical protein